MIRAKTAAKLDEWLLAAKTSLVGSFAGGVEKDIAAVRDAIISHHGQMGRLKARSRV